MDSFIGQIEMVAFNFAPAYWATCDGQMLSIARNTALFALLGTAFGGDGSSTFALPNLQGRAPLHQGRSFVGSSHEVGDLGGAETAALTDQTLPFHTHAVNASESEGTSANPAGNVPAKAASGAFYAEFEQRDSIMAQTAVQATGDSQAFSIMPPYLCLNFIICTMGIFPARY